MNLAEALSWPLMICSWMERRSSLRSVLPEETILQREEIWIDRLLLTGFLFIVKLKQRR